MKNLALASIVVLAIIGSCTKEEVTPRSYPRVNTLEVSNITSQGASFFAEIIYTSVPIQDHGFLWSDRSDVLFSNSDKISLGPKNGTGPFEAQCDRSLQGGKTYYVRGYAISEDHMVYGAVVKFVSLGSKAPLVKDFYPALATWDDTVTVVGENFSSVLSNNVIKFNEVEGSVLKAAGDTLHIKVPYGLIEEFSSVSVSRAGNVSTLEKKFQLRAPILASISPSSGTAGTNVIVSGQYIKSLNTKIYFNDIEATIVSGSSNSFQCKLPTNLPSGIIEVKLVTGSGNLFDTLPFEVKGPKLLQLVPSIAGEGDQIKLIGDFFSDDVMLNEVKFDNSPAIVLAASRTELTVIVPAHVNSKNPTISITISGAQASSNAFSFYPPEIESFTPQRGVMGTYLTLNGKYFRTGSSNKVFIGDNELSYVNSVSPTEISAAIYFVSTKHSEKIKVTFQDQEAYSVQEFKMPWIVINGFPEPSNTPGASVNYNNKTFAGFSSGDFNKFWNFDPATHTWDQLTDFPGSRRQSIVAFSAGSKGYFGGGTEFVSVKDLWQYDFNSDTWTKKSDLPMTGVTRVAFGFNNTGYLLELDASLNTNMWKYNHNTDLWTLESTAPFALQGEPGYFMVGNTLYLMVDYNLWKYDFSTSQWTDLGPKPQGVYHCFSIGNFGYGLGNQQMYKYDPGLNSWTVEASPFSYYPASVEAFSLNGRAFVFAGSTILEFDPSF